jgi:hypothetical protein
MDIDKKLGKIRPVTAPPFLFTRIEARLSEGVVSRKWRLSAAAGFAILLLLNIYVISRPARPQQANIETLVSGMMLTNSNNNLYDE